MVGFILERGGGKKGVCLFEAADLESFNKMQYSSYPP